jgi:hypothetical protein
LTIRIPRKQACISHPIRKKCNVQRQIRWLCFLAGILFTGCATPALWEADHFTSFREPANPSHLQVFQSSRPGKALVVYDETSENHSQSHLRRAYWADTQFDSPTNPRKPEFVNLTRANGLAALPILPAPTGAGLSIVSTNDQRFSFYQDGREVSRHELPAYNGPLGRAKQVALTPLAVAADATIVGGVLFYWAARSGGLSGLTWSP